MNTERLAQFESQEIAISVRTYIFGLAIVMAVSIMFAIGYFHTDPQPFKWVFFLAAGVLCMFGVVAISIYLAWRDKFSLVIDEAGIHETCLMGRRSIEWGQVESIRICGVDGGDVIGFRLNTKKMSRMFSFGQFDVCLLNSYAIKNEQLLSILNNWQIHVANFEAVHTKENAVNHSNR